MNDYNLKNSSKNQKGSTLIIGLIILVLVTLTLGYYFIYSTASQNNQQVTNGAAPLQTHTADSSSFENNVLVADTGKLELINILTGDKKTFLEEESTNSGSLGSSSGIFSPDKKWLLFKKDYNIWKIGSDGKEALQLTTQGKIRTDTEWGITTGNIKWSPDGKKIFYEIIVDNTGNGATLPHQTPLGTQEGLWVMDSDGGNQKYISQIKNPLEWMPDSQRIVYVDGSEYTSPTKTYDISTGETGTLFPDTAINSLYWSENGTKGVYTDKRFRDVYLVDNNMQKIDVLIHQTDTQYQGKNGVIFKDVYSISPDGKYAIIQELIRPNEGLTGELDANLDVYLWDTNTKEKIKLPIKFSLHTKPFWTSDSKKIIYVKQYPETLYEQENGYLSLTGDLYFYDLVSKKPTQVTTTSDIDPTYIDF